MESQQQTPTDGSDCCDQPWFWGTVTLTTVVEYMDTARDGTFLVFRDGSVDTFTLAVRRNSHTVYTKIYNRDGMYGMSEPLGFEHLDEVLDAIHTSPHNGDCLLYPAERKAGEVINQDRYGDKDDQLDILQCLRKIRTMNQQLHEQDRERKHLFETIELLDKELRLQSRISDGLHMVLTLLDSHVTKLKELASGLSVRSAPDIQAFDENLRRLTQKHEETRIKKEKVDEHIGVLQDKKTTERKKYLRGSTTINDLKVHIRHLRTMLEEHSESFVEFLDGLLIEDLSDETRDVTVTSCTKNQSEKALRAWANGSFVVRQSRKSENVPYVVSVRFQDSVEHFPVVSRDGYLGFDETTCIFSNIRELVDIYSRVSFRIHEPKYEDLLLRNQLSEV